MGVECYEKAAIRRLFCGNIRLFCGNIGLFVYVTKAAIRRLFCRNIRLFGGNIRLFCGKYRSLRIWE